MGENGNGFTNGAPWWVKAISMVGVPAAIALFLTWTTVSDSKAAQRQQQSELIAIKENLILHANDATLQRQTLQRIERVLQQICVNSARTSDQRNNCFLEAR